METRDGSGIRCNEHPDAPHGFMRDASHSAGRYVCECESWEPPKNKPMTRDEWKEWLAESWDEAQARAHTPDDIKKIKSRWEPVAYTTGFHNGHCVIEPTDRATVLPVGLALYRAPKKWVGLTDEEIDALSQAPSLTDELMDCVDRLGSEADTVDPRVWQHLLVYAPKPEEEPVAWITNGGKGELWWYRSSKFDEEGNLIGPNPDDIPLYTAPAKQWVGLTDEEINSVRHNRDWTAPWTDETFARAIEAKLKEKNT